MTDATGLTTTRWARVARGWAAAAFAISVAATSHMLAGGPTPTFFGVAVALLIAGTICTVLAGKTVSLWRLSVGVGASQVLFHTVFGGMGAPTAAAHVHGAAELGDIAAHAHSTMWWAHAVAGVITVVAFRYGEAAFWGIRSTARMLVVRCVLVAVPVPPRATRVVAPTPRLFRPLALAVVLSNVMHRGPPVRFAA